MKRYEYKVERIDLNGHADRSEQLGAALTVFGQDGWRLTDALTPDAMQVSPIRVVLERDVTDERFRRLFSPGA